MASGPSRINFVTFLLVLCAAAGGYWVWKFFPHYFTAYQVDHVLAEGAAAGYRTSILRGNDRRDVERKMVDDMRKKVIALGVKDPEMSLTMTFDDDQVRLACDYRAVVVHPYIDRFTTLTMHRTAAGTTKAPSYE